MSNQKVPAFAKGFGFMTWFWVEDFNYFQTMQELPILFSIFSEDHGGFECYFEENALFYWTLLPGPYSPPPSVEAQKICDFEPRVWVLFYLTHKREIFSNPVKIFINKEDVSQFNVSYPAFDKMKSLTHGYLFKNMTG